MRRPAIRAAWTWLAASAAVADPPAGLPAIPPSSVAEPASVAEPTPVADGRPSVTVGRFDADAAPSFRFDAVEVPGRELARRLALEVGLRLGREPAVRTIDATAGGPVPAGLATVAGSIETAGLSLVTRTVRASGYRYRDGEASLSAVARIVGNDGEVLWTGRIEARLDRAALASLGPDESLPEATVARLVAEAGEEIAAAALDRIAPLSIAEVDGASLRLNRGLGLRPGDRLRVLAAPPATRTVAIVEVRAVGERGAIVAVVEGDASKVVAGLPLRPLAGS